MATTTINGAVVNNGVAIAGVAIRLETASTGVLLDQDTTGPDGQYTVATTSSLQLKVWLDKGGDHEDFEFVEADGQVHNIPLGDPPPNNNPTLGTVSNVTFTQGTGTKTDEVTANDADSGDIFSPNFAKVSGPSWFSLEVADQSPPGKYRRVFNTNIPASGVYNAQMRATDDWAGFGTTKAFTITIVDPVTLNDPGNKSYPNNSENQQFNLSAVGGETPYTFSKQSGPSWVTVASNGTVTVDTAAATRGTFFVTFKVVDNVGAEDTEQITVTIQNNVPVMTDPANQFYLHNDGLKTLQLVATDADNDPLTYSKISGPVGVTISSSGLVTTDTAALTRAVHTVVAQVIDGQGGSHQQSFDITIQNNPPVLENPGAVEFQDNTGIRTFPLSASDNDNDSLTFTKISGNASITVSALGVLSVDTDTLAINTYPVTVEVSDGNGGTDQETFDVLVMNPPDMSFFQVVA